jgi:hypothetical protein
VASGVVAGALFTPIEWAIFLVAVVLCIVGIRGLATGTITV